MSASQFILVSCFLVHTQVLFSSTWIGTIGNRNIQLILNIITGMSYLTYPVIGWISEVYQSNVKILKLSFTTWFLSSLMLLLSAILLIVISPTYKAGKYIHGFSGVVSIVTSLAGLGMYEANAIQFGMDQMLEASSEQLSSFIHWYFWCVHLGPLLTFYALLGMYLYFLHCKMKTSYLGNYSFGWLLLVISSIQILSCAFALILTKKISKKSFCIKQTSGYSLKIIYRVLNYAYQHKFPERRSAFTYWENHTPSRIDLGKQKYGGPFTYEQVEDVKTFFRLLLLLLSLYGFQLTGDGYSLTSYILNASGCTAIVPLTMIIANPQHIPFLLVSVGVPLFQLLKRHFARYIPNMLTRLWIGLFLSLLNETVQSIYGFVKLQREFKCPEIDNNNDGNFLPSLLAKCLAANAKFIQNDSCVHFCSNHPVDLDLVYISVLPLLLHGAAYLLIFMTALEFICAQSPAALKGLLIGLWYSQLSIKYILINILDTYPPYLENVHWSIYHGIKGLGIFLSIITFSLTCKYYHYRERNEVVNEQSIIEIQYERELLNNSLEDSDSSDDS